MVSAWPVEPPHVPPTQVRCVALRSGYTRRTRLALASLGSAPLPCAQTIVSLEARLDAHKRQPMACPFATHSMKSLQITSPFMPGGELSGCGLLLYCSVRQKQGTIWCRYFKVTRPVLTSVTGAVSGAQGPSYPHGNNITVSAQLTALTNSACKSLSDMSTHCASVTCWQFLASTFLVHFLVCQFCSTLFVGNAKQHCRVCTSYAERGFLRGP